jgi:hypothetical protein
LLCSILGEPGRQNVLAKPPNAAEPLGRQVTFGLGVHPMSVELSAFIEHARERGMDHATIRMLLLSAGWKEKDVIEALAKMSLDMPIPAPPDRGGAREAFFHLLTFAAFYASVIAVVLLLFRYINRLFPDPAMLERSGTWELSAIRWSLAFVIVSFPLFLWLSRVLLREMRVHPERSWSGTRRWLTYLTLFLASIALGGDVITLVFRLLEGELTARFVLKALVVLVIAGLAFVYYFFSLRMPVERRGTTRMHRAFAGAASGVVLFTIVWGFAIAGSPGTARLHRFDERRVDDLQTIHTEIENVCLGGGRYRSPGERQLLRPLPATLEEVANSAKRRRPNIRDPETGEAYGYEVLTETSYRLCARFRFARDEEHDPVWNHQSGRHCFEFDVLRP